MGSRYQSVEHGNRAGRNAGFSQTGSTGFVTIALVGRPPVWCGKGCWSADAASRRAASKSALANSDDTSAFSLLSVAMDGQRPHITQSCRSCRRLKRRCTKDWPKCSLCTRVGRACQYPELQGSLDGGNTNSTSEVSSTQRSQRDGRNSFHVLTPTTPGLDGINVLQTPPVATAEAKPAVWFLDSVAMRGRQHLLHRNDIDWSEVVATVPPLSVQDATVIVEDYRKTTHTWLPCVSLQRLCRQLDSGDAITVADKTAMLYAMRLLSTPLSSATQSIYTAVKHVLNACESASQHSPSLLAAQVLLTFYEANQGLYPAAYYSLSRCSRMCYAVGLHDKSKATQLLTKADTWTEVEERRRLWWAVLILDRYVHAGFRFRPLMTPTISAHEIIPANDEAWDQGHMAVNPLLVMSIEAATVVSPYARLCQAAHLLGNVCQHVNEHAVAEEADFHFQEAHRLSRALLALLSMLEDEHRSLDKPSRLFSSRALCYTALLLLYDVHSCIEVDEIESCGGNRGLRLDLQQLALDGMRDIASRVCTLADEITAQMRSNDQSVTGLSPLVISCIYSAAGVYAWYGRERGDESDLEKLKKLRVLLQSMQTRWQVAGKRASTCDVESLQLLTTASESYLYLLEDTEHTYGGACYQ